MPKRTDAPLDPAERRRQVASILARGVIRWRRHARATTIIDAQESAPAAENRLELSRKTRLSVSHDTETSKSPRNTTHRFLTSLANSALLITRTFRARLFSVRMLMKEPSSVTSVPAIAA